MTLLSRTESRMTAPRGAALRQQRPCSPPTQPCPASAAAPRMTALRMTASLKAAFRRQRPCSPATCSCLTESRGGETLEHDAFPEFPPCGQLLFRPGEVRQLLCLCAALMRGRLKITRAGRRGGHHRSRTMRGRRPRGRRCCRRRHTRSACSHKHHSASTSQKRTCLCH